MSTNTPLAPLAGVKVVDLSAVVSGPMATGILAAQGADVIKVESSHQEDLTRSIGPRRGELTPLYVSINRGKRCIVLDLKHPEGVKAVRDLVARADVLVENYRPGALARLGLSYEDVSVLNPRLVYVSITGFGQSGPYSDYRAYDQVIQAVSGVAAAHPDHDTGTPRLVQTLMCDKVTSLTAAQAACAGLVARNSSGRGQKIEVSMLDASLAFLWPEAMFNHAYLDGPADPVPELGSNLRLWHTRDGWFSMSMPREAEFAAVCEVLGRPDLTSDPRFATITARRDHASALRALLDPLVAHWSVDELVPILGAKGVPVGRMNEKERLPEDPQVRHNDILEEIDQPVAGRMRVVRAAAKFQAADAQAAKAPPVRGALAPLHGQHTREVLRELGRSEAEIDALFACGAAA